MAELRDSPVFIAGHPKSGTSLLRSVLDSHPELITYPEETIFFRRYLPKISNSDLQEKLELSDQYLTHIFEWNQQNPPAHQAGFPDRDYSNYPVAEIRQAVRELVAERYNHDGDILSAVILAFGKVSGQLTSHSQHWVEKTPYNELFADQIFKWWPGAKIVHTVRDPRDNFTSYHRKHSDWSPEAFAMNWALSTQAGIRNLEHYGPEHYLLLRFEDLTSKPEEKLSELCQFLGINDDPSLRQPVRGGKPWGGNSMFADQFTTISAAPVGRWSESLKPDEVATIELVAGPVMSRFEYPLYSNFPSLNHSTKKLLLQRMLSLTRASKSDLDRAFIQSAFHTLSTSTRTKQSNLIPEPARLPTWRLFTRLALLWIKESFNK